MHLIAARPGGTVEEKAIQEYFAKYRLNNGKRGNSYYRPDNEIYEYVERLIDLDWASPSIDEAESLTILDFNSWKPGASALEKSINGANGQHHFFNQMQVRDRIEWKSRMAHLASGSDDWYTKPLWIALAREAMGSIDTDPATTRWVNNQFIKARIYYDKTTNGLNAVLPWEGNVWLNPPYGRGDNSASAFCQRLVNEYSRKNITQAITCLNLHSMSSKWYSETIFKHAVVHLIPSGRPEFNPADPSKNARSPANGIVFSYFGLNPKQFCRVFGPQGMLIQKVSE